MPIYRPFTYRITFKPTGQQYYGVRTRKNCHPSELWTQYFTSSKKVKQLIAEFGTSAFDFEIRKTFTTKQAAILWEHRVLTRLDVVNNNKWLNENNGDRKFTTMGPLTEEHKKAVSKAMTGLKRKPYKKHKLIHANKGRPAHNKGKPMSEEQKTLLSKIRSGSKSSEETKAKISAGLRGRVQSPETREKMALKRKEYWDKKRPS
jgi:Putative endonuclease segE, GIY-YIG domain/NUMOD3 motif